MKFKKFKKFNYINAMEGDYLELESKYMRIISPANFVYDFSTKMFLMLYSTN